MCCGQKRAALTTQPLPAPREIPNLRRGLSAEVGFRAAYAPAALQQAAPSSMSAPPDSASPKDTSVHLQYREQSPIQVRGLATGLVYRFSGQQPVQAVDERDAAALLQTRLFRRCGSP